MQVKVLVLATSLFLHAAALPLAANKQALTIRQDDPDDDGEDADGGSSGDKPQCQNLGGIIGCVTDGLDNFSPLEDGQFETDADASDGNDSGASNSETANGATGGGTGSSANNNGTAVATSSQCSLFGCTSSATSGNAEDTSTSTSTSGGLINGPILETNGPLIQTRGRLMSRVYALVEGSRY